MHQREEGFMETKNILHGRAWVCGDQTDTFMILPQQHWAGGDQIDNLDPEELGKYAMEGLDPSFSQEARSGKYQFIVAGRNFGGGGKSIEHPIIAVKGAGIKAVIAESVSRYFFRNAINNALPIVVSDGVTEKVSKGDELEVDLDSGEIRNVTTGAIIKTQPLPGVVLDILSKGGYINYTKEKMAKN
jgi:3-isopropylmalate/(R)-2-methylmalate dehydratase small subunit